MKKLRHVLHVPARGGLTDVEDQDDGGRSSKGRPVPAFGNLGIARLVTVIPEWAGKSAGVSTSSLLHPFDLAASRFVAYCASATKLSIHALLHAVSTNTPSVDFPARDDLIQSLVCA